MPTMANIFWLILYPFHEMTTDRKDDGLERGSLVIILAQVDVKLLLEEL